MTRRVVVVDYGVGNLLSLSRAIEHCGGQAVLSAAPDEIASAERLLLPGVGAFGDAMIKLDERGLVEPIVAFVARGRPLLGICLGMQLLLDESDEFGQHAGLGLIPGRVAAIPAERPDGGTRKIPHIGWNHLAPSSGPSSWAGTVLERVTPGECVYFVHSFMACPANSRHRVADCDYDGVTVAAVVQRDEVVGCQFHPEKSGPVGLRVMSRFCGTA